MAARTCISPTISSPCSKASVRTPDYVVQQTYESMRRQRDILREFVNHFAPTRILLALQGSRSTDTFLASVQDWLGTRAAEITYPAVRGAVHGGRRPPVPDWPLSMDQALRPEPSGRRDKSPASAGQPPRRPSGRASRSPSTRNAAWWCRVPMARPAARDRLGDHARIGALGGPAIYSSRNWGASLAAPKRGQGLSFFPVAIAVRCEPRSNVPDSIAQGTTLQFLTAPQHRADLARVPP